MTCQRIAIILQGQRPNDPNQELARILAYTPEQYLQRLRLALDAIYISEAVRLGNHQHMEAEDASTSLQVHESGLSETNSSLLQSGESSLESNSNNMRTLPNEECSSIDSGRSTTPDSQECNQITQKEAVDANL